MSNTNDLIRIGDAIDVVYERIKQIGYEENVDVLSIRQAVREVPTVVLIRCKDCLHWKHGSIRKNYCDVLEWCSSGMDYCSFAEKMKGE